MRQISRTFRLVLLSTFLWTAPLASLPTDGVQPTSSFNNQLVSKLSNRPAVPTDLAQAPEQTKGSTEALAEAQKLSQTVVKLFTEGKYDEALPLAKRALALREAALGPDHEVVQGSLLNLAELYTVLKKYGEAQNILERLLRTHEQKVGPEDAGAAIFLDKLAFLTYAQRDFKKSEAAYKRALAIREKAFGPESAEVAGSLFALAEFYRFRSKFADARPLYERAALLRETLSGRDNPEYSLIKERYLCLVYEAGTTDRETRLKEFRKKFGEASPSAGSAAGELKILNGVAISMPAPAYPVEARRARAQGTVVVKITIDEAGKVVEAADMCNANPLLVKPSVAAARITRFTPTKLGDKPIRVTGVLTYTYVVQ